MEGHSAHSVDKQWFHSSYKQKAQRLLFSSVGIQKLAVCQWFLCFLAYENLQLQQLVIIVLLMGKQVRREKPLDKKNQIKKEQEPEIKQEQNAAPVQPIKAKKADDKKQYGKRNRLIIRNLVFDINEKHLKKLLQPYGEIVDLKVPMNPNNQKINKGFAFVEFAKYRSCQKVIKELNQSKFKGRPIVIDFSIAKSHFMADKIKEDDEDENKPEENVKTENKEQQVQESKEQQEVKEQKNKPFGHDPEEDLSRTIFIRNMPTSVDETTLREVFAKFGKVKWAKVVVDKQTHTSKGTAFVKYVNPQNAKDIINYSRSYELFLLGKNPNFKSDPKINLEIDGTIVKVFPVEKRQTIATKLKEREVVEDKQPQKLKPLKKIKKLKDLIAYDKEGRRRIALATLGLWEPTQDMDQNDKERFKNHAKEKVEKLKNPNNIVSDKRIILKFLDKSVTQQQIRDVAHQFLSANQQQAKQLSYCKLMLDTERKRSAGYAFLQFKDPQVSKMFVQQLVENQESIMPNPFVVEFALQDSRKMQKLQTKRGA